MKHKKFLLIALICLIGIGISFLLFSAHRPFKDLAAADITSASVRLSPPDTTIQIVETEELVSYLNAVLVSCLYCGASPDVSDDPAPKAVRFW